MCFIRQPSRCIILLSINHDFFATTGTVVDYYIYKRKVTLHSPIKLYYTHVRDAYHSSYLQAIYNLSSLR